MDDGGVALDPRPRVLDERRPPAATLAVASAGGRRPRRRRCSSSTTSSPCASSSAASSRPRATGSRPRATAARRWPAVTGEPDIELVVTDVEMPEMDGIELLRAIREDGEQPSLPVVVVTSRGGEEDRQPRPRRRGRRLHRQGRVRPAHPARDGGSVCSRDEPSGDPTRMLVCDDSATYARALAALPRARGGELEVVGICATGEEPCGALPRLAPDLVTMDLELPGHGRHPRDRADHASPTRCRSWC